MSSGRYVWTPEAIALLGTMSDTDVAMKLRIHKAKVKAKRKQLEIPACELRPYSRTITWTDEMDALLGVLSDCEIARRYQIATGSVWKRRVRLGIQPAQEKPDRPVSGEAGRRVSVALDADLLAVAERLGAGNVSLGIREALRRAISL